MQYSQFRSITVQFFQQAPACLDSQTARKLSGHSGRRFHPTIAGIRRCSPIETAALGNWSGGRSANIENSMPIRYHGARDLTELGVKMESISAASFVLGRALPGSQLTWARFASELRHAPDFADVVATQLAAAENPTGSTDYVDIYGLPSQLALSKPVLEVSISSESSSSSSSSSSESESDSKPKVSKSADVVANVPKSASLVPKEHGVDVQTAIQILGVCTNGKACVSHATRHTVHIRRDQVTTTCGEKIDSWPGHQDMSLLEVATSTWPLCSKPACFRGCGLK
ncbi:unnamed protein product [Polarella glacialis]|uniref:Uncharacterized protein n=1 Tax=Polarella glacialis TaxID=89957 RepID=A0A813FNJ0_POLGL|nr:unnamed protein product [Polarella glacialis]